MKREFDDEQREDAKLMPARPILDQLSGMYSSRRREYGPSEQKFAEVMMALFPNGVSITDHIQWVRYGLIIQIVNKLCRYSRNPYCGHLDSTRDLAVYAAMLEAEDRRHQGLEPFNAQP